VRGSADNVTVGEPVTVGAGSNPVTFNLLRWLVGPKPVRGSATTNRAIPGRARAITVGAGSS
jgi:hypothetical protein